MASRSLVTLAVTSLLTGCSEPPRTPIQPDPTLNNLAVVSVSAFITAGDYRLYQVRIRVRETSGDPITISAITVRFVGDSLAATRTFSDISQNTVAANASIDLDDLAVADELHQLDSAQSIVAMVTYSAGAGQTGTAVGEGSVPNCATYFDVWGATNLIAVGESMQLFAGLETGCSPMHYPVTASSISWRSLNPAVASVDSSGVIIGLANGLAVIQGTYGGTVASHKLRVGPLVGPPAKVMVQGWKTARPGQTMHYDLFAEWPDGITRNVTDAARWESSNPSIATISSGGNATARSEGTAVISGTYDGIAGVASLMVTRIPNHVMVDTPAHGMKVGETYGIGATAHWEVPGSFDVRLLSEWRSSDPAVATISSTGEATGVGSGTTEISATYNGVTGSRRLIVHAQ